MWDNSSYRFVTREDWNATPSNNHINDLVLPIMTVVIAHTDTAACSTFVSINNWL